MDEAGKKRTSKIFGILMILVGLFFVYQFIDTFLFSYAKGSIVIRFKDSTQVQTIQWKTCQVLGKEGQQEQLMLSDQQGNTLVIDNPYNYSWTGLTPFLQGKNLGLSKAGCHAQQSTLKQDTFFFRNGSYEVGRSTTKGQSWKGSIEADCALPDGTIHITADIHACQ